MMSRARHATAQPMPETRAPRPRVTARALRAAIDQAVDVVVLTDAAGRILYANAAIEGLVGRPASDLTGRHFIVALSEGDDARSYGSASATLSEGRSWTGSRVVPTGDGLHVNVEIVASPVRDETGAVTQVLAIARRTSARPAAPPAETFRGSAEPVAAPERAAPSVPRRSATEARAGIERILRERAFQPTFQPIVRIADGSVIGHEGLTRFDDGYAPEVRFAEAFASGLGIELEMATLEAVLAAARQLPGEGFLSVNVSPALVLEGGRLGLALADAPRSVVLEITEQERVDDYAEFRAAISRIGTPLRWAIDDAGAGFASLRHILELRPQFVKLDRGLIAGIALDPVRQALAAGLLHFSHALGTTLVAEGIETEAERLALHALGVSTGQGFLFGAPTAVPDTGA
jgi:PAS domain S-box-containing protein